MCSPRTSLPHPVLGTGATWDKTHIRYPALVWCFSLFLIVSPPHSQSSTHTKYLTDKSFTKPQLRRHSAVALTSHASTGACRVCVHAAKMPAAQGTGISTKGRLAVGQLDRGGYWPDAVHRAGALGSGRPRKSSRPPVHSGSTAGPVCHTPKPRHPYPWYFNEKMV